MIEILGDDLFKSFCDHLTAKASIIQYPISNDEDFAKITQAFKVPKSERNAKMQAACQKAIRNSVALINWIENNKEHLIKAYSQGAEDEQEVFTRGVCMAMVHRITKLIIKKENISAEKLKEHINVYPRDRVIQAAYAMSALKGDGSIHRIPQRYLNPYNENTLINPKDPDNIAQYTPEEIETLKSYCKPKDLKDMIQQHLGDIEKSSGIVKIGVKKHIVFIQIDPNKQFCRLFDPNFGLYEYKIKEGQPFENLKNQMLDALLELDNNFYGSEWFHLSVLEEPVK